MQTQLNFIGVKRKLGRETPENDGDRRRRRTAASPSSFTAPAAPPAPPDTLAAGDLPINPRRPWTLVEIKRPLTIHEIAEAAGGNDGGSEAVVVRGRAVEEKEKEKEKEKAPPPQDAPLCAGQQRALDAVLAGKSIFLTGAAGTGKSMLLKRILQEVPSEGTYVTASTGVAAVNVGGTTLHSFIGIGLGDDYLGVMIARVMCSEDKRERLQKAKMLIVDEISMISGEYFDKADKVMRAAREEPNKPFGGVQLVLVGDFLQLKPVSGSFCFEADCWSSAVPTEIVLTEIFRQRDPEFVHLLNELRKGRCDATTLQLLAGCVNRTLDCGPGIVPTKLFSKKGEVNANNARELAALPAQARSFRARDKGRRHLLKDMQASECLVLKVGAQVMLLKNLDLDSGLCNGSRGVVIGFDRVKINGKIDAGLTYPMVRFTNGLVRSITPESFDVSEQGHSVASRQQIPLMLAWAITIHKSQGSTLKHMELSLESAFTYGQAYVAVSRGESLQGIRVVSFNECKVKAHPLALAFVESLEARQLTLDTGGATTGDAVRSNSSEESTQKSKNASVQQEEDFDNAQRHAQEMANVQELEDERQLALFLAEEEAASL